MKIIYLFLIVVIWVHIADAQPRKQDTKTKASSTSNQVAETPRVVSQVEVLPAANTEPDRYRKERDDKDDAFRTKQTEQNEVIKNATKWMAIFTFCNLLLAIVFAIFAGLQWRTMGKQWVTSKEALKLTNTSLAMNERSFSISIRPALVVNGSLKETIASRQKPNVVLTITNSGNSVASDVQLHYLSGVISGVKLAQMQKGEVPKDSRTGINLGIVGAKLADEVPIRTFDWEEGDWADCLMKKMCFFYVWGELYYTDILGDRYITTFCLFADDRHVTRLAYNSTYNKIDKYIKPVPVTLKVQAADTDDTDKNDKGKKPE